MARTIKKKAVEKAIEQNTEVRFGMAIILKNTGEGLQARTSDSRGLWSPWQEVDIDHVYQICKDNQITEDQLVIQ